MSQPEIQIPDQFICPISLNIMKEPVMSKDGKNFEKAAILDWLNRGNRVCPLTRKTLKPSLLVPNTNLKMSIYSWKKRNGIVEEDEDETDASNGFVGVLHIHDQPALECGTFEQENDLLMPNEREPILTARLADEELLQILDLYNEVLDLTSTPLDEIPQTRGSEITSNSIDALVSRTARRKWRPKFFGKKGRATS